MKTIIYPLSLLIIVSLSILTFSFTFKSDMKIAYVRSAELVDRYQGMMDARTAFQNKSQLWQAELDSIKQSFQNLPKTREEMSHLSTQEWERYLQSINGRYYRLQQLEQDHVRRLEEEDRKLTQAVLDQVNGFTETYARENGYTLVLGTTQSGNLLYAEDQYDITNDLLDALNNHYNQ